MPANNCHGLWGQLVTWLLVIGGWLVFNHQHNCREDRKESRAAVDKIRDSANELEAEAIKIHKSDSISYDDTNGVTWKIKKLIDDIDYFNLLPEAERNSHAKQIRRSITLNNFDISNHHAILENDKIIREIKEAIDDLIGSVERKFRSTYPLSHRFPRMRNRTSG